jgi:hypothetical protein
VLLKILCPPTDAYDKSIVESEEIGPDRERGNHCMAGEQLAYLAARLEGRSVWITDLVVMSVPPAKKTSDRPGKKPWQGVRKAKVARARTLVKDSNYPPKGVTDAIADLLARHLKKTRGRSE